MRPVLKYQGSKYSIAPWVISHFPPHTVYVEPFGGSAAVLMQKPRATTEIYNDIDSRVVKVFRVLQDKDKAAELERSLWFTPFSYEENRLANSVPEEPGDDIETARRTIVRSFMGVSAAAATKLNSGFFRKIDRDGKCNNAEVWWKYPGYIAMFCSRIQGVILENRPAEHVIKTTDSERTLFYLDPPYVKDTWTSGKTYTYELSTDEHTSLLEMATSLQGMVVLSGYDSELYNDILHDWKVFKKHTINQLNQPRVEVLWVSPRAWQATKCQASLFSL